MEKLNLFEIPIFKVSLSDWDSKKKLIMDHYNSCSDEMTVEPGGLITNYFKGDRSMITFVYDLFRQEILDFMDMYISWSFGSDFEIYAGDKMSSIYGINCAWYQKQDPNSYHGIHVHGAHGFSAVCYVNMEEDHMGTEFVAPFNNFDTYMIRYARPPVKEGDIVFFPSSIPHYTTPIKDLYNRIILSFNIQPLRAIDIKESIPICGNYYKKDH